MRDKNHHVTLQDYEEFVTFIICYVSKVLHCICIVFALVLDWYVLKHINDGHRMS